MLFSTAVGSNKGELQKLCGHLEVDEVEDLCLRNVLWTTTYGDFRFMYTYEPGGKPSPPVSCWRPWILEQGAEIDLQHYSMLSLQYFHSCVLRLKREHFRPIFCSYRIRFVIYLFATSVNVENVPRCVRKVIFGGYLLQHVIKCFNHVPVHSLSSS